MARGVLSNWLTAWISVLDMRRVRYHQTSAIYRSLDFFGASVGFAWLERRDPSAATVLVTVENSSANVMPRLWQMLAKVKTEGFATPRSICEI